MSAQPVAPRKSPAAPQSDDALVVRALELSAWARTNIRLIVGGAVVLAVLVGGLLYYRMYQTERQERAATELLAIQQTAAAGNFALASRDIEAFIARYEGMEIAEEARVELAQLYLSQEQPESAVEALSGATDGIGDSTLGAQSALLLGAAQIEAGDREAALATYLEVADEAEMNLHRVQALHNAAILRSEANDFAGAAELYRRLVELEPEGSIQRQAAQMRLAEAEARAAAN